MKMNKENLQKQVETINKKQLICLCKSLIDIYCELEDRKDKAIEKYEKCKEEDYCTLALDMYDILRGKDNEDN